ncbi:NADH-quinone oxidoreductase subunit NuoE family protein [Candidatus Contubernalis alkaliaceticus]|uniref:NADH-quinone oxidoreductase subunit NuoE family protein n=1 Tax=Candidatus Contubernalis alkaliaceticus TaxID=338645 RepID=UPI001F4C10E4|nr:NAD(P)H-dependent oxidoreductase subunit E [Candidatus Contubernalis alkalaceticus]
MFAIDKIINKYRKDREGLIALLQDISTEYRYLSEEALKRVSEEMEVPLSKLFSLATFYKSFRLTPRGEHEIQVCMGTACHVRGAPRMLENVTQKLNIKPGDTTEDGKYTVETVNCLGTCALGPLLVYDGKYFGKLNRRKIEKLLEGSNDEVE